MPERKSNKDLDLLQNLLVPTISMEASQTMPILVFKKSNKSWVTLTTAQNLLRMESRGDIELSLLSRMELDMKVSGMNPQTREMVRVTKSGLMGHSMKDTGRMTKPMAEEDSSMLMEMCMKVSGKMIKHMDTESTCTQMVLNMKDIGGKINNTEKVRKHGLMGHATKETT